MKTADPIGHDWHAPDGVVLAREPGLSAEAFLAILDASGLAPRRPVHDAARIADMIAHANLLITARHEDQLIGVARFLTDFGFFCYCSDLAVDQRWQRRGIGKALMQECRKAIHPNAYFFLRSAPDVVEYYANIGMTHFHLCFDLPPLAGDRGLGHPKP